MNKVLFLLIIIVCTILFWHFSQKNNAIEAEFESKDIKIRLSLEKIDNRGFLIGRMFVKNMNDYNIDFYYKFLELESNNTKLDNLYIDSLASFPDYVVLKGHEEYEYEIYFVPKTNQLMLSGNLRINRIEVKRSD